MAAKTTEPTFNAVTAPPPKVREPILSRESAEALATQLSENEFVSDGVDYGDDAKASRTAHTQVSRYRNALASYSLIPDGMTLRSRFVNGFLYLRWGTPRGAEVNGDEPATDE